MIVELLGDDSLPAVINMHMAHGLLAWLVQLCNCLNHCLRIGLRFHRKPRIAFARLSNLAHSAKMASSRGRRVMDVFNFAKSIEEFIYDLVMWIIFYPYTLARILLRPRVMMDYVAHEIVRDDGRRFDNGISPPLFLLLSIVLAWLASPMSLGEIKSATSGDLGRMATDSTTNLIVFRLLIYCSFPLIGALIYEWRTPGGISREAFRVPFFQQCYISGPYVLVDSALLSRLGTTTPGETGQAAIITGIVAASLWFIVAQHRFFREQAGTSTAAAALFAVAVFVGGWACKIGVALLA